MKLMIDILAEMLPNGLEIEKYKEQGSKYILTMVYNSNYDTKTSVELPKTVIPGTEQEQCNYLICTAMSAIMINQKNFEEARKWLDMIVSGEYKEPIRIK